MVKKTASRMVWVLTVQEIETDSLDDLFVFSSLEKAKEKVNILSIYVAEALEDAWIQVGEDAYTTSDNNYKYVITGEEIDR